MTAISSELPRAEPLQGRVRADLPPAGSTLSRQGESLADVAQRAGTSEAALREANPTLTPFDVLPANTFVSTPTHASAPEDAPVPAPEGGRAPAPGGEVRTPHGTLAEIDAIPRPDTRDLPPQLPAEDKQQILDARQAAYDARVLALAEDALAFAEPPQLSDYASLPPGTARAEHQMALQQYHTDVAGLQDVVAACRQSELQADRAFWTLTPEQRQGVRDVLASPDFQALPVQDQQAIMASMRAGEYYVTGVSTVEAHAFHSGEANAVQFDITIAGETTTVYMPVQPDPALAYHGLDDVANALASLPAQSRERIERVDVNPQGNPDDAYWAEKYDMPGFRSYMTAGAEGVVSIYPSEGHAPGQDSLNGGLSHEVGHIVSGQDMDEPEWAAWETAMAGDGQSVSDYADSSRGEDFAETYTLYMSVVGTPQESAARAQYPERFEILDGMTGHG